MRDVLTDLLAADPDLQLIELDDPRTEAEPHVILLFDAADRLHSRSVEMLHRVPRARVLAVSAETGEPVLYELRPHRRPLGPASPQDLVAAVRRAGRRQRTN